MPPLYIVGAATPDRFLWCPERIVWVNKKRTARQKGASCYSCHGRAERTGCALRTAQTAPLPKPCSRAVSGSLPNPLWTLQKRRSLHKEPVDKQRFCHIPDSFRCPGRCKIGAWRQRKKAHGWPHFSVDLIVPPTPVCGGRLAMPLDMVAMRTGRGDSTASLRAPSPCARSQHHSGCGRVFFARHTRLNMKASAGGVRPPREGQAKQRKTGRPNQ